MNYYLAQAITEIPNISDAIGGTVFGVVVILFLFGWLWPKPAVEELKKVTEKREKELASLRQSVDEKIIPAIEQNTMLAEKVTSLLESRVEVDKRIMRALDKQVQA